MAKQTARMPMPSSQAKLDRQAALLEGQDFEEEGSVTGGRDELGSDAAETGEESSGEEGGGEAADASPGGSSVGGEGGELARDEQGGQAEDGSQEGQEGQGDPDGQGDAAGDAAAESSADEVLNLAKEMGYGGDDVTEATLQVLQAYRQAAEQQKSMQSQLEETRELARFGTEYLRQQREREESERKKVEEQAAKEPWWNPPQFDSKWLEQYRDVSVGEDGQPILGWKPNTPPQVRESAEHYQQYLEQWATDLVQRPQEVLPKIIEQEFERLFEARIQEREQATRLTTFAERVKDANRDWMYTTDPSGREALTAEGQAMTRLLSQVANSGVQDPELQWNYAVAMYDYQRHAQQPAAPQMPPAETSAAAAEKRRQHLRQGVKQGVHNRTGTVPKPEEESIRPQNPTLSPGNQLLNQLRQDGVEFL